MPDPRETRPVRPDPMAEGPAPRNAPSVERPTSALPCSATAITPDPQLTCPTPAADDTVALEGEGPLAEPLAPDPADEGGLGLYHRRAVVGTWSHGRIEAAEHARLAFPVLLRILDADAARDPELRREFLRQARAVAMLDHPNLADGVLEANGDGPEPHVAFRLSDDRPLQDIGRSKDWLRSRDCRPYDNRRLACLLVDAARGLRALHNAGLVHGALRPESLRLARRSDRLRLHDLPSMPLITEAPGEGPPGRDLADLAAAVAVLLTGRDAPPSTGRARPIARAMRRANPCVDPALALILGRCRATDDSERIRRADDLIAQLGPLTCRRIIVAKWSERVSTMVYEYLFALICSLIALIGLGMATLYNVLVVPILVLLLVLPVFEVGLGWTLGRRLQGLRLVDVSGNRPGRWKIAARATLRLGWIASSLAVGYGLAWMLGRAARSGWPSPGDDLRASSIGQMPLGSLALVGLLAGLLCAATTRLTRSRRPVYDVLTGVTWGVREWAEPPPPDTTSRPGSGPPRSASAAEPAITGDRVGPNRLERELGRGGMGAVYAAWDEVLHRPVAVKLITGTRDASPEILRRFEQEARLAAKVRHENVAQVFSVGRDRHRPYMVLELLHGRTLQQLVDERGPLPLGEAWSFIMQAAAGLQAANHLGIIHRDIKPSNLMVTHDGLLKVLDFGISKLVVDEDQSAEIDLAAEADRLRSDPSWRDTHLTRTGALLGTPLYMSPEQARRRRLDCRSDIYSLGLTMYHLLAGHAPFDGRDAIDLLLMQCQANPPSLRWSVPELTPERCGVLEKMIAKDPAARFQNYEELLDALRTTAPRPPERAAVGHRVLAALADMILYYGIKLLFDQVAPPGLPGVVLDFFVSNLVMIVPIVGVWLWGTTPGQWVMRLHVTRPDGGHVSLGRSLLRQFAFWPAEVLTPIGSVMPWLGGAANVVEPLNFLLWLVSLALMGRPRRQALHDLAADTIVIRVPRHSIRRRGPRRTDRPPNQARPSPTATVPCERGA